MYVAACLAVFFAAYALTIIITSVGYHRALAHGSVRLHPWARKALLVLGPWVTGFDAKAWVVMHRAHHLHSDKPEDPHSPVNVGARGMFQVQLKSFIAVQEGLLKDDPKFASLGRDLDMSWIMRTNRWWAPYILHVAVGLAVGLTLGWWIAIALITGLLSHVVQGAIINYFGHAWGGRNFDLADNSRNNHAAAWLVLGEGFQNNHHRYPSSARFSYLKREVDLGYGVCKALELIGVLHVVRHTLMPRVGAPAVAPVVS